MDVFSGKILHWVFQNSVHRIDVVNMFRWLHLYYNLKGAQRVQRIGENRYHQLLLQLLLIPQGLHWIRLRGILRAETHRDQTNK